MQLIDGKATAAAIKAEIAEEVKKRRAPARAAHRHRRLQTGRRAPFSAFRSV